MESIVSFLPWAVNTRKANGNKIKKLSDCLYIDFFNLNLPKLILMARIHFVHYYLFRQGKIYSKNKVIFVILTITPKPLKFHW